MINGKHYYFFRLDTVPDDPTPEYRIAESLDDLHLRFGDIYFYRFHSVTQLNEVTIEHITAINRFLLNSCNMAKYHFNVYCIRPYLFDTAVSLLRDFYCDIDSKFPYLLGSFESIKDLNYFTRNLPESCVYMVCRRRIPSESLFTVFSIPILSSSSAIELLIRNDIIDIQHCSRDLGFYELKKSLDDLPYNCHYIVQRYYE